MRGPVALRSESAVVFPDDFGVLADGELAGGETEEVDPSGSLRSRLGLAGLRDGVPDD